MIKKILVLIFLLIEVGLLLPSFIAGEFPTFLSGDIVILLFIIGNLLAFFSLFL